VVICVCFVGDEGVWCLSESVGGGTNLAIGWISLYILVCRDLLVCVPNS